MVTGAQAAGTTQWDYPLLANAVLNTKFKVVSGYKSSQAIHLAMEREEVHGNGATNWTTLLSLNGSWVKEKKVNVIAQWAMKKHPDLPDVPMVLDLAKTPDDRAALELLIARLEYGRPYFVPPGTPDDRVQALRRAFDATMKDPEFLADAKKLSMEIDPITGEQAQELIARVLEHAGNRSPRACARRSSRRGKCASTTVSRSHDRAMHARCSPRDRWGDGECGERSLDSRPTRRNALPSARASALRRGTCFRTTKNLALRRAASRQARPPAHQAAPSARAAAARRS